MLADPEVMLADPKAMLADPLVSREKELWMTYAFAAKEVDLFDQSTWDGVDYEPLVDLVHELIVPHAVHQQLAESYVQSAALVAQTNVDEDRRSNRVNALSYVVRDFSKKAKAEIKAKTGKDVRRVESKDRVRLYSEHCDEFREKVDKAKAILGKEKYKDLVLFLQGDANRVSRIDLEARKVKYANGIQKPRKLTKAEQIKCGLDVPAEMDGGLRKKDIQRKYDAQIRAEIEFRKLQLPKPYEDLTIVEKKELLINSEMGIRATQLKARDGISPGDITYITPQSEEMQELVKQINNTLNM